MTATEQPLGRHGAWDGAQLLGAFRAAASWLDQHVARINGLNVFPVPDGDTGTNMNLTLASALKSIAPSDSCAEIARQVSVGALYGARGNSGVILSQILRGIANGLAGKAHCEAADFVAALAEGSRTAYRGASEAREGTILTVSREAAEAAEAALSDPQASVEAVLAAAVAGAQASVERTPELLEVLRKAGVVDAGGEGYRVILEGMLRWSYGESLVLEQPDVPVQSFAAQVDDVGHAGFGFCTNVLLSGDALPFEQIRAHIKSVGESVVVVGDETLIRIHVHTTRPGDILNYVGDRATIAQVEITNMDLQREALKEQQTVAAHEVLPAVVYPPSVEHRADVGTVVVAPGKGFIDLFLSMNADAVVLGGQTMNPSTQDILEAIEGSPQDLLVILPNNGNVIRSAQEARQLSKKQVRVVPTRTVPQGVAALLGRQYHLPFDEFVAAMERASSQVTTVEITTAVRDADFEGIQVRAGQTIALIDGRLSVAGDDQAALIDQSLQRASIEEREVLTIYYGQSVDTARAQALAERISQQYPELEVEVQSGGQPHYDYIIGIE